MAKSLYVLVLFAACAAAQTVEGSVFDAATGVGIGGVKVELLKGATAFYETTTDGGGRFFFEEKAVDLKTHVVLGFASTRDVSRVRNLPGTMGNPVRVNPPEAQAEWLAKALMASFRG